MVNVDLIIKNLSDETRVPFTALCEALRYTYLSKGWSTTEIANATRGEATSSTIQRLLRRCNIVVRRKGGANYKGRRSKLFTKKEWMEMTTAQLASRYNMSTEGIRLAARRYGYPKKGNK